VTTAGSGTVGGALGTAGCSVYEGGCGACITGVDGGVICSDPGDGALAADCADGAGTGAVDAAGAARPGTMG